MFVARSLGMIRAPSTSPSLTFWIASSLLFTRTGSIASNRRWPSDARSIRSPPSSTTADWPSSPL